MANLLIRNIDPKLKQQLVERAHRRGQSLSATAQELIELGLAAPSPEQNMGDWLYSLLPVRYRGDDLVFEIKGEVPDPPDFR